MSSKVLKYACPVGFPAPAIGAPLPLPAHSNVAKRNDDHFDLRPGVDQGIGAGLARNHHSG